MPLQAVSSFEVARGLVGGSVAGALDTLIPDTGIAYLNMRRNPMVLT